MNIPVFDLHCDTVTELLGRDFSGRGNALGSGFPGNLAGDVFRDKGEDQGFVAVFTDLVFNEGGVGGVFVAQPAGQLNGSGGILDDADPAEDNDTADTQCPVAADAAAFVVNAEGCLVAATDGIDLMALHTAVEINLY